LDEVSVAGKTKVAELKEGEIISYFVEPKDLGINKWPLKEIKGGDRKINAMIIRDILSGREKGAKRDMTLINSAFCLIGAGVANSLREGVMIASDCIDSGDALKKLNQLVEFTNSFSSP